MTQTDLIGAIYETAAMPERWPALLGRLAEVVGAVGGTIGRHKEGDAAFVYSPSIAELAQEFVAGGWHLRNERGAPLWHGPYAGFLTDYDLHSDEARRTLPCYTEFFGPRGAARGAGTLIQGASDDGLVLTVEVFPDDETLRRGVGMLDTLRPHLARAVVLSSELRLRQARVAVEALEQVGTAAALLGSRGRLLVANAGFSGELGGLILDGRDRLRLAHARSDAQLEDAIDALDKDGRGISVAIRDEDGTGRAALHLVPVKGDARDIFVGASAFALVSRPHNRALPNADLIQTLFDLTPAEARIARLVADGRAVELIARQMGKSTETVRSHLKRIYSKTATGRQNELSALLMGFSPSLS